MGPRNLMFDFSRSLPAEGINALGPKGCFYRHRIEMGVALCSKGEASQFLSPQPRSPVKRTVCSPHDGGSASSQLSLTLAWQVRFSLNLTGIWGAGVLVPSVPRYSARCTCPQYLLRWTWNFHFFGVWVGVWSVVENAMSLGVKRALLYLGANSVLTQPGKICPD